MKPERAEVGAGASATRRSERLVGQPPDARVSTTAAAALDIEQVDLAIEDAIRVGEAGPLRVLGYGEISLVVGWPSERPELAVKRLPPFRDRAQLDRAG